MKKIYLFLLASALAVIALAADPTGKWTYETQGRNGPQTVTLTLNASGDTLTGSISGGRGGEVNISDGKVNGDNISFNVVREFNGNQITTKYTGKVSGDTLDLTIEGGRGGAQHVTAKKSS
ncbi:MAG TPA: hypothetical protein VKX49_29910 [Bryobacteraceae bacterium]|nr:hypothetical protein [Bryobacteraceae bacterium]